jgi:uncharacterized protein YndB with AHSA1/START domain
MDHWFAEPGMVLMKAEVNAVFFWMTHHAGAFHPHYGRFLRLEPDQLVELTWLTGPKGAEPDGTFESLPTTTRRLPYRLQIEQLCDLIGWHGTGLRPQTDQRREMPDTPMQFGQQHKGCRCITRRIDQ